MLGILAEGDSYGYAILQRVRDLSGGRLEWSDGMLYPLLHRLERLDQVESQWVTAPNGRPRKQYRLSRTGLAAFEEQRRQWNVVTDALAHVWSEGGRRAAVAGATA